jgi:acyl-CoA thioester hydrolase
MEIFRKSIEVRWSDTDANAHMSHTAYASFATHLRVSWLNNIGFSLSKLISLGYTAMLLKEETEYLRQVYLGDTLELSLLFSGASSDYTRWKFINKFYNHNGKLVAVHTVNGVWVNIAAKKISTPPAEFLQLIQNVPKDENFEDLTADPREYSKA